jgi:hypothetical protein
LSCVSVACHTVVIHREDIMSEMIEQLVRRYEGG